MDSLDLDGGRAQARLARDLDRGEPEGREQSDPIPVDQADAAHRHAEDARRHRRQPVERGARWSVEDLVAAERLEARGLVAGNLGGHAGLLSGGR